VAAGVLRIAFVFSKYNNADLLTKPLAGVALKSLIQNILW